jgi:hypothetical protein
MKEEIWSRNENSVLIGLDCSSRIPCTFEKYFGQPKILILEVGARTDRRYIEHDWWYLSKDLSIIIDLPVAGFADGIPTPTREGKWLTLSPQLHLHYALTTRHAQMIMLDLCLDNYMTAWDLSCQMYNSWLYVPLGYCKSSKPLITLEETVIASRNKTTCLPSLVSQS